MARPKHPNLKLNLKPINPLTDAQEDTFFFYNKDKNLVLSGSPGTGKTFLSLYLGLKDVFDKSKPQEKLVIVRSCVQSREVGYLPGKEEEKNAVYELPYKQICSELFRNNDSYEVLKTKNKVDFISTSFIRGVTLHDSIVVVDEVQNMSIEEINTIITRLGGNSRIMLCGDLRQCDFGVSGKKKEVSGFLTMVDIINNMDSFKQVEFNHSDIIRSGLVEEWIVTKDNLGY